MWSNVPYFINRYTLLSWPVFWYYSISYPRSTDWRMLVMTHQLHALRENTFIDYTATYPMYQWLYCCTTATVVKFLTNDILMKILSYKKGYPKCLRMWSMVVFALLSCVDIRIRLLGKHLNKEKTTILVCLLYINLKICWPSFFAELITNTMFHVIFSVFHDLLINTKHSWLHASLLSTELLPVTNKAILTLYRLKQVPTQSACHQWSTHAALCLLAPSCLQPWFLSA